MSHDEIRRALLTFPARIVLALTVWAEARGESPDGQLAVCWVIKNRATRRHQTIQGVCLQKHQFSCWWGDDANTTALFARADAALHGGTPGAADDNWLETAAIAHRALLGGLPDITHGADHYLTTTLYASPQCPVWAAQMTVVNVIDHHTFLRSAE
ncbi:MAG: cell wall hydrolase [Acidobacteria bacterium]|nr:cell wall hydrolase [Acidobacteriota bacterium]